ncbi:MAG TPA: hypothetical protein PKV71_07190 [Calditrichia bacterium]|nr:hypothetical protein [Calditrichota bacterium]HQV31642.1 hypothetical protein [Calditrichia bacterium]
MARFLWILILAGMPLNAQKALPQRGDLEAAFRAFDYQTVIRLSSEILSADSTLEHADSLAIVEMQTVAFFSMGDMQGALNSAFLLLNLDPQYQMNPARTSPKIIRFVEDIRGRLVPPPGQIPGPAFSPVAADSLLWAGEKSGFRRLGREVALNLILPGWGHLRRGQKGRALLFGGVFAGLAGSSIWAYGNTRDRENQYLNGTEVGEIARLYQRYDDAYRQRNLLMLGTLGVWLLSQADLIFRAPPLRPRPTLAILPVSAGVGLAVRIPLKAVPAGYGAKP